MAASILLQLSLLTLVTNSCLAMLTSMTIIQGSTLTLNCPLGDARNVEWKNPRGEVMFFDRIKGLGIRDKRNSIETLSSRLFEISVTDVTFKDGGNYTCSQYGHGDVVEKVVAVTVLGQPKVKVLKHRKRAEGIKCTAEGNHYPPQIFWQFGDGVEISTLPHYTHYSSIQAYYSESILSIQPLKSYTVCCLVRHPQLHTSEPLRNCVKVSPVSNKISQTTWTPSPVDEPQGSTDSLRRTTIGRTDQSTKDTLMATYSTEASPEATSLEATAGNTASSTGIRRDSMTTKPRQTTLTRTPADQSQGPTDSWRGTTDELQHTETGAYSTEVPTLDSTTPETAVSTGWYPSTSVAYAPANEFTEMNITQETSHNSTKGNGTRSNLEERENQRGHQKHASWLIFLVTCLIVALSVVVLFLAIKLRRAHIHWKRENEDSDQSSESHKTKSSDEEKRWPGQKCRGIFNIVFTKYAVEEPTGVSNITAPVVVPTETYIQHVEPSQSHVQPHANVPAPVKETAL